VERIKIDLSGKLIMKKMLIYIRHRLWLKVMFAILPILIGVIGIIIFNNIYSQGRLISEQNRESSTRLATSIEGGMFESLAAGNNDEVRSQFKHLGQKVSGLEVNIFDFEGKIAFSTHKNRINKPLDSFLPSDYTKNAADSMLTSGVAPDQSFDEMIDKKSYLTILRPIKNEARCFHCHGRSRKVLGGIQVRTSTEAATLSAIKLRNQSLFVGMMGVLALAILIYFLFHHLVNRPVKRVLKMTGAMRQGDLTRVVEVSGMDEMSHMSARMNLVNDNLKEMISGISTASQSVAESASQQAAAIKQTSSSLEGLESMTQKNNQTAQEANGLMQVAKEKAIDAKESMSSLNDFMEAISKSSEKISKIVGTIDDISFQTNLLALNAAVEAARAGEAGAGFSVVAEEVRNRAMRAAQAASDTGTLIKDTVERLKTSTTKVNQTSRTFSQVVESANKVAGSMDEIASASQEQSSGLHQITQTVNEVDRGIQQNASTAEELASSVGSFKIN